MISVATPWAGLRRVLPPYLSLVAAEWPVDGYVLVVKERDALRSEASNAIARAPKAPSVRARKKVSLPRHARPFIVVHRCSLKLCYKRVEAPALRILTALADGQTLEQAVVAARPRVKAERVHEGFADGGGARVVLPAVVSAVAVGRGVARWRDSACAWMKPILKDSPGPARRVLVRHDTRYFS
jgi:hypothetical protein